MQVAVCISRNKKVEVRVSGRACFRVGSAHRAAASCWQDDSSKLPPRLTDDTQRIQESFRKPQQAVREPARVRHGARAREQEADQADKK